MSADATQAATADAGTLEVLTAQLAAAEATVVNAERQRNYLQAEKVRDLPARPALSKGTCASTVAAVVQVAVVKTTPDGLQMFDVAAADPPHVTGTKACSRRGHVRSSPVWRPQCLEHVYPDRQRVDDPSQADSVRLPASCTVVIQSKVCSAGLDQFRKATRQETVLRLWEVTRGKLEGADAATRDREAEMERHADRHAMELKVGHDIE